MSESRSRDWSMVNLGEVAKFTGGNAFPEILQGQNSGDFMFAKVSDMNLPGNERFIKRANNWISQETVNIQKVTLFPAKTTIFAKVGAALLLNRRRQLCSKTAIDNNLMAAIPKKCNADYLYYILQQIDLGNVVQTGAVPSVNQSQLESLSVLLTTDTQEQQKIAEILTSVDEFIENTQSQIDKLEDLKKATMNELLTKGIGHTEFKDTEIGRIPKTWEVRTIGEISKKVGSGVTPRGGSSVYLDKGVKFLRSQNIHFNGLKLDDVAHISIEIHESMSATKLQEMDVLLNITGASIGRCTFVPKGFGEGNVNQHVCIIRTKDVVNSVYLSYWLSSDFGQNQIDRLQAGGNREGLNFQQIRAMTLPVPQASEQHSIVEILTSIDKDISNIQSHIDKTGELKESLMQDLLTGKVRVKVH